MISQALRQNLLQPLGAEAPCGEALRHDPLLDRLRELRREDDSELPQGVWQSALKRADWEAVEALATQILVRRSKDLTVAAYLGEAWLLRYGVAGLADALGLLADLGERFAESLHPQAVDGDRSWRAAPLAWLARRYGELLLTRTPLCSAWPQVSLHAWQQLQRRQVQAADNKAEKAAAEAARLEQKKLDEAIRSGAAGGWGATLAALEQAAAQVRRLDAWCDRELAEEAPSLHALADTIDSFAKVIQGCKHMAPHEEPVVAAAEATAPAAAHAAEPLAVPPGRPASREEAYRQLAAIADYLARTEPHSPVPYVIRRAVEWGQLPLSALLDELLNADAETRRVWALLGVLR